MRKESDLKKLIEIFGKNALGKIKINDKKAFLLKVDDSEAVVLEKYLGNGLQKNNYTFSDLNKPLRPNGKPEIIYEFHKDFDYFRSVYDGRIIA